MQIIEHAHQAKDSKPSPPVVRDVKSTLIEIEWPKRQSAQDFRNNLLRALSVHGWSNPVRIDQRSKISITSMRDHTGLCIQTGNMGRFYADLMKLETLYRKKIIEGAIYIIPTRELAKEIGANVANFERFVDELKIFEATITIPIIVFGISGRKKQ